MSGQYADSSEVRFVTGPLLDSLPEEQRGHFIVELNDQASSGEIAVMTAGAAALGIAIGWVATKLVRGLVR